MVGALICGTLTGLRFLNELASLATFLSDFLTADLLPDFEYNVHLGLYETVEPKQRAAAGVRHDGDADGSVQQIRRDGGTSASAAIKSARVS